jgi:molecular chaperone GrpE
MSKQQKIAEYSKAAEASDEEQKNQKTATAAPKDVEADEISEKEKKDPLEQLQDELEQARNESKDHYDRLLRAMAEFDNYKKRSTREMQELRKYANEAILKELLHIIDNLERASASAANNPSNDSQLVEGVDLTLKELFKILEKNGVQAIDALEKEFDPTYHEAMMQEDSSDHPDNTVIRQLQKGYTYHERLLRPAMVVVSKKVASATEGGSISPDANDDASEDIEAN